MGKRSYEDWIKYGKSIPGLDEKTSKIVEQSFATLHETGKALGISETFFLELQNEDDWGYVLKTNALGETCTIEILNKNFLEDARESLAGMGMKSRLSLIRSQHFLPPPAINGLDWLYALRNTIAHSIRGINFQFDEHFKSDKARKTYTERLSAMYPDGDLATVPNKANVRRAINGVFLVVMSAVNIHHQLKQQT